jgi:N-acetylneuraminate synthase
MSRIKIIAEVGINHNGDINKAKKLIDLAAFSGCDYVKFQKRNPDVCVPESQKEKIKETPWGKMTYLEYKKRIEFSLEQYRDLKRYCKSKEIGIFTSVWDVDSCCEMKQIFSITKIPSAHLVNDRLLRACRNDFETVILSTGMSIEEEISTAIKVGKPDVIMHTNSVYPTPVQDLNLSYLKWIENNYFSRDCEVGYSSHYYGLVDVYCAIALGAKWVEKHICLSHQDWGSDQSSSVEPHGLLKMVKGIRDMEKAVSKGYAPRTLFPGEEEKKKSLRSC